MFPKIKRVDQGMGSRIRDLGYRGLHISRKWGTAMAILALAGGLVPAAKADVQIKTQLSPNATVPDRGQTVSTVTIANAGISTITGVTAEVVLNSPSAGNPMWLGDMFGSLTHGTALETARTTTLFNYPSTDPNNSATFLSASYSTSALNGAWLPSNSWSLLVADREQGGQGRLANWGLTITGTAASSGTMDPGQGGQVGMTGSGTQSIGATVLSTGTGANAISLAASSGQTLDLTGGISGSGNFNKTGSGILKIGDSSGFTGTLQAQGGKVVVDGTMNSASKVVVGSGATVGGSGTVGALEIASGGKVGPGNSPGQLGVAGNATWAGGARYEWEINNFLGSAGSNWDFLNIAGTLSITATTGSKFLIDVVSLLADNSRGNAQNFDAFSNYSFDIATAAGGITGFDVAAFTLDTSGFANPMWPAGAASGGSWSVSLSGNNIRLNYAAAIPEPSSAALVVLGLVAVLAKRRRCAPRI